MLSGPRSFIRMLVSGSRKERDLDDEIAFHLSEEADERMAAGVGAYEAQLAARRDFGNVLRVREATRVVWSWQSIEGLALDTQHALRSLLRSPGFTVPAVLTLGLGIGATTAMFSTVNAVVLNELPYSDADRIVVLRQADARNRVPKEGVSAANLRDIAVRAHSLSVVAGAEGPHGLRLMEEGSAVSLRAWLVSEGFFDALGADVVLGRGFLPSEFRAGNDKVVVLSHQTWQTRFAGETGVVGRELVLDGARHTVVGVLSPDFKYPSSGDVWAPRPPGASDVDFRNLLGMDAVARLNPNVTRSQAQAELDQIAQELARAFPAANADLALLAIPLKQHLVGDVQSPLILLLGAVGLVLLIASANVAGLQLARGVVRTREYAVRAALGGGHTRILRLVFIESVLLAAFGALVGIALASVGADAIRAFAPSGIPRIDDVGVDGRVLGFAVAVALASAVVASASPAARVLRMGLHAALTERGRGSNDGIRGRRVRDHLVIAEIAMALMLTVGAGLLVRSFERLLQNELGFTPDDKLVVQVWAYDDQHQIPANFFEHTRERIRGLSGVKAVGLTTDSPLADDRSLLARTAAVRVVLNDRENPIAASEIPASLAAIDDGYATAMGLQVRAGRAFTTQDRASSQPVAMVNETFARRYLADGDAVGRRIMVRGRGQFTVEIVGVLADVRRQGFESAPRPEVYVPLAQRPSNGLTFVVKTAGDPAGMTAAVERAMWSTDPRQAVWAARSMTELLSGWTHQRRFNMVMLLSFAVLALGLAAIGVYAIMSFVVGQRANELGIRRALGGSDRDILWLVLRGGFRLALVGAVLGLVGAAALAGWLRGMLYDIEPLDPLTFGAVGLFVVGVGLLSTWLPARRAMRIDPVVALRAD